MAFLSELKFIKTHLWNLRRNSSEKYLMRWQQKFSKCNFSHYSLYENITKQLTHVSLILCWSWSRCYLQNPECKKWVVFFLLPCKLSCFVAFPHSLDSCSTTFSNLCFCFQHSSPNHTLTSLKYIASRYVHLLCDYFWGLKKSISATFPKSWPLSYLISQMPMNFFSISFQQPTSVF